MRFVDLGAQRHNIGEQIDNAIRRVVDHGQYIMGPEVFELEERLAAFCGARHAISCSSGTDALLLGLLGLSVGSGDAVFVPAFTFAATAEVVALLGAIPVLVDVDAATYNVDPASLNDAVSAVERAGRLRPAGLIAVDLFGLPADYGGIATVAAARDLWVLGDAAQSFGATYHGRRVGVLASATATSFFPAKPLGCYGDGGAVFTDDDQLAGVVRSLRVHGQGQHKYENVRVGMNARLDTIQAAILVEKLAIFPDELEARRRIAERYTLAFPPTVNVPSTVPGVESAWAQYTVRVNDRRAVQARLTQAGIPTAVYYPTPLHHQPAFRAKAATPVALDTSELLAQDVLSLPIHPYLKLSDQNRVISELVRAVAP